MIIFRNIFLYALFISIACHLAILSLFSFRMPTQNIPVVPFINFLGSFLGPYDTQIIDKEPPTITAHYEQELKLKNTSENNFLITNKTKKTQGVSRLPSSPKKTLPVFQTTSSMPTPLENDTIEDQIKHEPLALPDNDHY
jgi:hypothetical protein